MFVTPKGRVVSSPVPPQSLLPLGPWPPFICLLLLLLWLCLFWTFHISGIILYVSFCIWFLSLSVMFSEFIHVGAHVRASLLLVAEWYSTVCINHGLLLCSSAGGPLGCFHLSRVTGAWAEVLRGWLSRHAFGECFLARALCVNQLALGSL